MRAFFPAALMALLIGVPIVGAAAHDGWFVRVCRAKTQAGRIHLAFSGGRQGYSWSWINSRTLTKSTSPAGFTPWRGSPCVEAPPRRPLTSNRDHIVQRMEFDDHEDHQKNWDDTDDCAC
jgi:hypothetical protein